MISKEKIQKVLQEQGMNLAEIFAKPHVFDRACNIVYKRIPIPFRWFIGKKRIRKAMNKLKEQLPQSQQQPSEPSRPAVSGRF